MRSHSLTPPKAPDVPARPGTFRRIIRTFQPYRGKVALVGILIVAVALIGLVNPLLIKVVFDKAILGDGDPDARLRLLLVVVGVMILSPIVGSLLQLWQIYESNRVGQRVMQDLRNSLYSHMQHMPLKFFTSMRTGEIQSRLSNDVNGVQRVLTDTAGSMLSNTVTVATTVVAMLLMSVPLTILSFLLLPVFMVLARKVGHARREISGQTQESLADLTAHMQETLSISGILLSKSFGRQSYEIERFRRENRRLSELEVKKTMVGRGFSSVVHMFFAITPAFVYLVGGWLFLKGQLGSDPKAIVGTMAAFTTLQSRLFFPVGQMLYMHVEVQSSLALFDRIFEFLDLERDIVDRDGAIDLQPQEVQGAIAFNDMWFRYERVLPGQDVRMWTVSNIDFQVSPGQLVALVGPSGAGKTTLTYLIPRLYDVGRGSITIDDIDVRDIRLESLGEIIGVVTQETYLFNTTIRDNLRYGKPDATDEELVDAARAAHIYERITELPDGFDTWVGERGYKLSGGEKQRLAIARVLLKDPRILILDEATSALDTHSERLVQEALDPLMRGRTTVAIAHRLSTILAADTIVYLDRGRIIERGSHTELLAKDGAYAALYHEQFSDGAVESRCSDGLVLSSGEVVPESLV